MMSHITISIEEYEYLKKDSERLRWMQSMTANDTHYALDGEIHTKMIIEIDANLILAPQFQADWIDRVDDMIQYRSSKYPTIGNLYETA